MTSGNNKHGGCCYFGTFFLAKEKASIFVLEMKCFTSHFSFLFSLFLHEGVNCFCHMRQWLLTRLQVTGYIEDDPNNQVLLSGTYGLVQYRAKEEWYHRCHQLVGIIIGLQPSIEELVE